MTYTDSVTLYYDKREPRNRRQYFNSADELYAAKGRTEYIGRGVIASWLGIKNVDVTKSSAQGRCADKHLIDYPGGISGEKGSVEHMTIGETIRKYRIAAGMTQQQVGEAIGLKTSHRQRLSDWETGGRVPSPRHLLKIMAVLKIPPTAFDEFKNIKNLKGEKTMKETIMVNGNEIEVTKYEPSAEFESINTIDDLDFDDLWTDGDYIYTFCGNDYQSIWHYC